MTYLLNIAIIVIAIILLLSNDLISKIINLVLIILLLMLLVTLIATTLKDKKKNKVKKKTKSDEEEVDFGAVIGIDLGTTHSRVGVYRNGDLKIIPNDQGECETPSYVAFTADGDRLIGDDAKQQSVENPKSTIFNVQRLLGCQWRDQVVQENLENFSFEVVENNSQPCIKIQTTEGEKTFVPELISAMIIAKLKELAENYLRERVTHVVVTVPANFNDAQRRAIETAVTIAGLKVLSLTNAPSAAAIAYNSDKKKKEPIWSNYYRTFVPEKKKVILVFNLGGGHFDVSLISIDDGNFTVLSTDGDTHLGGEDFNQNVTDYLIALYQRKTGKDIRQDGKAVQKLRMKVEEAKIALSDNNQVKIEIGASTENEKFEEVLTRDKFEKLNDDLFRRILKCMQRVFEDTELNKKNIDDIILVGGSTRIPKVRKLVKDFLEGQEFYPNIDESVLLGAAVQANVLSGKESTATIDLRNVTPLSLGVQDAAGWIGEIIPKNTVIPIKRSVFPVTSLNGQTSVIVKVYEGPKGMESDNRLLGYFELTGIRPAPAGEVEIEVTLEIDNNGILRVTAQDKGTNNREELIVTDRKRWRSEDIETLLIRNFNR